MDTAALRRLIGDVEWQYDATSDAVRAGELTALLRHLYTTYAQAWLDRLCAGVDLVDLCERQP